MKTRKSKWFDKKPADQPGMLLRCFGVSGVCAKGNALVVPSEKTSGLTAFLFQHDWFMSVVSGIGEQQFSLAPLCRECAVAAHPPEVFAAACKSLEESTRKHKALTPALPDGALEERRKAGREVVAEIEAVLARPGMYVSTPDELRGMLRGMLYALCAVRPSHGSREAPIELPAGLASLDEAAAAGRESLKDVTNWLNEVEDECRKKISS
jgi:hypothetical protein